MITKSIVAYFHAVAAMVWPWIADTNRFNRRALLKPVTRRDITLPDGTTASKVTQQILGWLIWATWVELKPQWDTPRNFFFQRPGLEFHCFGLIVIRASQFTVRAEFSSSDRQGVATKLEYTLSLEPDTKHWSSTIAPLFVPMFLALTAMIFRVVFSLDDRDMRAGKPPIINKPKGMRCGAAKKIDRAYRALVVRRKKIRAVVWDLIMKYLTTEHRLRPFEIADREKLPQREVLLAFVWMMEYNIVQMSYDSLCPGCRGVKKSKKTLRMIERAEVCVSCQKQFTLNINQRLEVTFKVHPRICTMTTPPTYCIASPMHTAHIVCEVELTTKGNGSLTNIPITMADGKYRIRVLGTAEELRFEVKDVEQPLDTTVIFTPSGCLVANITTLTRGQMLVLDNRSGRNRLVVVERSEWFTDMVSTLDLLMLKDFRMLFPREVVRGAVKQAIQMGSLAVMFNDLKGSTVWWHSQKRQRKAMLIIKAFERIMDHSIEKHNGTILKTNGDAVEALFRRKGDGVRAMLEAQSEFHAYCERKKIDLKVRLGMHYGSLLLTTSIIGQLDAFNPIVNEAARLESQTDVNDRHDHVIVTEVVESDRRFREMRERGEITTKQFQSTLKGVGDRTLYRVYAGPSFGLPS